MWGDLRLLLKKDQRHHFPLLCEAQGFWAHSPISHWVLVLSPGFPGHVTCMPMVAGGNQGQKHPMLEGKLLEIVFHDTAQKKMLAMIRHPFS